MGRYSTAIVWLTTLWEYERAAKRRACYVEERIAKTATKLLDEVNR